MKRAEVRSLLEEEYANADPEAFIREDPLCIPRSYTKKEDIEVIGFMTATISWGQRPTIIKNARSLEEGMGGEPFRFVLEAGPEDLRVFSSFQHRTFNSTDLHYFLKVLRRIYETYGSMQELFREGIRSSDADLRGGIERFREVFFSLPHSARTEKHVADPAKGSSAKRLHMFLRWMIRDDAIDIGIWKELGAHRLSCPLDLHSAKVGRKLGLIRRKQNDAKTVAELDRALRRFDPKDPVKYDISLHSMGVADARTDREQA